MYQCIMNVLQITLDDSGQKTMNKNEDFTCSTYLTVKSFQVQNWLMQFRTNSLLLTIRTKDFHVREALNPRFFSVRASY